MYYLGGEVCCGGFGGDVFIYCIEGCEYFEFVEIFGVLLVGECLF